MPTRSGVEGKKKFLYKALNQKDNDKENE